MKWKNILTEERNRSLLLVAVVMILGLIILIRFENKNHLSELQETVTSIYEDRLVAKNYIFEISKKVNAKKVSLGFEDQFLENSILMNDSIDQLIQKYEGTELTGDENNLLRKLKDNIRMSEQFESKFLHNLAPAQLDVINNSLLKQYNLVILDLEQLSEIQLEEGKKLLDNSYQILESSNSSSHLEVTLIVVVLLIMIKIFSAPKKRPEREQVLI
ncbi:MAG: MCP four helix bundle domain-containing protein [Cyclobacteriaceae bacterium]